MQNKARTLITASVAVLFAGCGGSNDNIVLNGPDPTALTLSAQTQDGLTATLTQDKSTIPVTTGTVNYTIALTNNGTKDVTVTAPQDAKGQPLPPATLAITDSSGSAVFPGAYPNPIPTNGKTQSFTLQPKGFLSETVTLPGVLKVIGRYQATVTFTTSSGSKTVGPLTITAR